MLCKWASIAGLLKTGRWVLLGKIAAWGTIEIFRPLLMSLSHEGTWSSVTM